MPIVIGGTEYYGLQLQHLLADLRMRIPDLMKDKYTDEWLTYLLNRGQQYLVDRTGAVEEYTTITTVEDQAGYTYPTSSVKIIDAFYNNNRILPMTIPELSDYDGSWKAASSGTPIYYYVFGQTFNLYPPPDTADVSVDVYYIKKPTSLSDQTDQSELPEHFDELIVMYALYRVQLFERDQYAMITKQELNEGVSRLREQYKHRGKKGNLSIYPY